MEKLSTYLKDTNTRITAFAKQIGVSRVTVHRILSGDVEIPDKQTVRNIYTETGGHIDANDFYNLPPTGHCNGQGGE